MVQHVALVLGALGACCGPAGVLRGACWGPAGACWGPAGGLLEGLLGGAAGGGCLGLGGGPAGGAAGGCLRELGRLCKPPPDPLAALRALPPTSPGRRRCASAADAESGAANGPGRPARDPRCAGPVLSPSRPGPARTQPPAEGSPAPRARRTRSPAPALP